MRSRHVFSPQDLYFARMWDEAMTKAGLQSVTLPGLEQPVELHFHDLRGTTVTLLSEAGCTPLLTAHINSVWIRQREFAS